jgi:Peptidase M15
MLEKLYHAGAWLAVAMLGLSPVNLPNKGTPITPATAAPSVEVPADHLLQLLEIKAYPPVAPPISGVYRSPDAQTVFSKHFVAGEFNKYGARPFPNQKVEYKCRQLANALEVVRSFYGGSITINSGYRSAATNRAVGGAPNSQHVIGCAVDVVVQNKAGQTVSNRQVYRDWVDVWLKVGGIGLYSAANGSTHFDLRDTPTTWDWTNAFLSMDMSKSQPAKSALLKPQIGQVSCFPPTN